jgi:hypothetical protein
MRRRIFACLLFAAPIALYGQDVTGKPDSVKSSHDMMGPWKEMNTFHRVMGATWHPALQKNDLAPLKERAKELATAAYAWAASKPPAMPASCRTDEVKSAVIKVAREAKALSSLIDSGADDTRLKAALKDVHDTFEVAEKACGGHGDD